MIAYIEGYLPSEYVGTFKKGKKEYIKVKWSNLSYRGEIEEKDFIIHRVKLFNNLKQLNRYKNKQNERIS